MKPSILSHPTGPGYWWGRATIIRTKGRKNPVKIEQPGGWWVAEVVESGHGYLQLTDGNETWDVPPSTKDVRYEWVGPIQPPGV